MKVICNRSDECMEVECYHIRPHVKRCTSGCHEPLCPTGGQPKQVECIDDETYEVKPMPIRFELID